MCVISNGEHTMCVTSKWVLTSLTSLTSLSLLSDGGLQDTTVTVTGKNHSARSRGTPPMVVF